MESVAEVPPFPFEYAKWPRRILSSIIDAFVIAVVTLPLVASTVSRAVDRTPDDATTFNFTTGEVRALTVASIIVQVTYMTALHAWRGATIGKMAARIVLVRDDGTKVSPGAAFTRAVTLLAINFVSGWLFFVPAIVNLMRPLWHPRRQTWHDQVAKTVVILREADANLAGSPQS